MNASSMNSRAANLSVPQPPRNYNRVPGFPPGVKDLSPSVTITPAPPQPQKVMSDNFFQINHVEISCQVRNYVIFIFIRRNYSCILYRSPDSYLLYGRICISFYASRKNISRKCVKFFNAIICFKSYLSENCR